jgi:hypothetical protein
LFRNMLMPFIFFHVYTFTFTPHASLSFSQFRPLLQWIK